jgi:hypothetical protein
VPVWVGSEGACKSGDNQYPLKDMGEVVEVEIEVEGQVQVHIQLKLSYTHSRTHVHARVQERTGMPTAEVYHSHYYNCFAGEGAHEIERGPIGSCSEEEGGMIGEQLVVEHMEVGEAFDTAG